MLWQRPPGEGEAQKAVHHQDQLQASGQAELFGLIAFCSSWLVWAVAQLLQLGSAQLHVFGDGFAIRRLKCRDLFIAFAFADQLVDLFLARSQSLMRVE